jgi:hypothetical protein
MKRKPAKKKSWFARFIVVLVILAAVIGGGGYLFVNSWIQNYLRSDACRAMIAQEGGRAARAECTLEPLSWSGSSVYSPRAALDAERPDGWRHIEAEGVRASLDWSGVRRGVWSVPAVTLDSLRVELAGEKSARDSAPGTAAPVPDAVPPPAASSAPRWLAGWIPKKAEVGEVNVDSFELKPPVPGAAVAIGGMRLHATPAADEGAWQLRGTDGRLALPGMKEAFRMSKASARIDARALALNDAQARWLGDSEVTARGILPFGDAKPWSFSGHLSGLDLRHVLPDEWKANLGGVLDGDYETSAQPRGEVLFKGKLNVKGGVVQNLHVQHLVADFTRTERFRRIVWDEARADVEVLGSRTQVSDLALQSNGLIRIEGGFVLQGEALNGTFLVGISPETLRWKGEVVADTASGTAKRVFTQPHPSGRPGFVWTTVHVSGTPGAVREDLSRRLAEALGIQVLEVPLHVAGKAADIVGKTGGTVLKDGTDAVKGAVDQAGGVLEKGLDTAKRLLPPLLR